MSLSDECPATPSERQAWSVTELTQQIRGALQTHFSNIWVAGEISDLSRPRSGHVYFSLKDESARLSAVMWRSTAERTSVPLADGLQVCCQGEIDVFPPHGKYQLIVRQLETVGEGALQRALRQLRNRLAAEGLFETARKRPLPFFPTRVAVVTSPSGAALRDFLEVASRRGASLELLIVPTRVQGSGATAEIVAALQQANQLQPAPDVIVVTRGGGSMEDLWCFNEEAVVRAIYQSASPVVSAVGHEIDVTLADLVADCRALTPSEAAERVIPSAVELRARLQHYGARLRSVTQGQLRQCQSRLASLASRPVMSRPLDQIRERAERLDELDGRLQRGLRLHIDRYHERARSIAQRLEALSPLAVLTRGYSVTTVAETGQTLCEPSALKSGDRIITRLAKGSVSSIVD